jgi:cell division protein FtsB
MRELREKQKLKRRLYSIPVLLLLTFVTGLFIRGTYVVFTKKIESAEYVKNLSLRSEELKRKQAELSANIASLGTESGLEKEVKAKYNVAKEGERFIILVDQGSATASDMIVDLPWWKKAWNAIISAL